LGVGDKRVEVLTGHYKARMLEEVGKSLSVLHLEEDRKHPLLERVLTVINPYNEVSCLNRRAKPESINQVLETLKASRLQTQNERI
jgi:hypothetical protein